MPVTTVGTAAGVWAAGFGCIVLNCTNVAFSCWDSWETEESTGFRGPAIIHVSMKSVLC